MKTFLVVISSIFGFILLLLVIQTMACPPIPLVVEVVDPIYGPKPDRALLLGHLIVSVKKDLDDPSSMQDEDVSEPVRDTIKVRGTQIKCWCVGVSFRSKNRFGALVKTNWTIWMKDGKVVYSLP